MKDRSFPPRQRSGNGKEAPAKEREVLPPPGGKGRQDPRLSEASYLRFLVTNLEKRNLELEKQKYLSDKKLVEAMLENVDFRIKEMDQRNVEIWKGLGINVGDSVAETPGGGIIIRGGSKKKQG